MNKGSYYLESMETYQVKYNKELFKFGAFIYLKGDDPLHSYCIGLEEDAAGVCISVSGDGRTIVLMKNGKMERFFSIDPETAVMYLPVWAWEILNPRPKRISGKTVMVYTTRRGEPDE